MHCDSVTENDPTKFAVLIVAVPDSPCHEHVDIAVIGGGMAGLTAAYELRDLNVALLEAERRVGGRVYSQSVGEYWLNWGAHMMSGPEAPVGRLIKTFGLHAQPIGGRLIGIVYRGRRTLRLPTVLYPLSLVLSPRERVSLARMGLALRQGTSRFVNKVTPKRSETEIDRRRRFRDFENRLTLADYVGPLEPAIATILQAITERTGADPEEMAAGHGLRSFANVWSNNAPGWNIVGGSGLLPEALARALGSVIRTGSRVVEMIEQGDRVLVRYDRQGDIRTICARTVIVATPAASARAMLPAAAISLRDALAAQQSGPFLTAALETTEAGPAPWDGHYAIATPGHSFSVLFNMATTKRNRPRNAGGSLMLFRGARGAAQLMDESDRHIETLFLQDLEELFPEIRGNVRQIVIQRWSLGAPFLGPRAAPLQSRLDEPCGRIVLAGDYLEAPNLEAAVASAMEATKTARRMITEASPSDQIHKNQLS